ncbi:MAG: response regulator, partial [Nitrososphaeria archaeon]|nr:response regulator [Nitrososphaeria archaeon]
ILIVEDEELIHELIKKKLEQEGYEVSSALDGAEGLKKIKEGKPNLVLLDVMMPKMGGFEMMEE